MPVFVPYGISTENIAGHIRIVQDRKTSFSGGFSVRLCRRLSGVPAFGRQGPEVQILSLRPLVVRNTQSCRVNPWRHPIHVHRPLALFPLHPITRRCGVAVAGPLLRRRTACGAEGQRWLPQALSRLMVPVPVVFTAASFSSVEMLPALRNRVVLALRARSA